MSDFFWMVVCKCDGEMLIVSEIDVFISGYIIGCFFDY